MEATDRESEAPILKSGMKRFFKRCWRTGITAECLSVLWFSQQLLIRLTSHVVGVSLRTRGSAESRASSWDQSAAALHPPDVHVMSTGLLVCCWSRWMCSETAAARSFAIFPPDKTQTHHLSPAAPQRFPLEGWKKEPVVLSYKTILWRCLQKVNHWFVLLTGWSSLDAPGCSVTLIRDVLDGPAPFGHDIINHVNHYSWHHRQEVKSSDVTTFTFILLSDLEIAWSLNSTH